jgi:hypothetical protein
MQNLAREKPPRTWANQAVGDAMMIPELKFSNGSQK